MALRYISKAERDAAAREATEAAERAAAEKLAAAAERSRKFLENKKQKFFLFQTSIQMMLLLYCVK
jgi:hypothetical protein